MKCTGAIKVFNIEDFDRYAKARGVFGIPPQKGKKDAVWENNFINLVFFGKAFDKIADIFDKEVIYITSSQLRNSEYTNRDGELKTWTELKVFDFVTMDEAKEQGLINKKDSDDNNGGRRGNARSGNKGRDKYDEQEQEQDEDQEDNSSRGTSGKTSGNKSSRGGSRARK